MRYGLRDISKFFATPAGRLELRAGVLYRLWPILSRLARRHRRVQLADTTVVAVVGSLGKSTATRAVALVLGAHVPTSLQRNSWSNVALALLRVPRGTPHCVIEVGIDGPGQMQRYASVVLPDVTVVTSIASEHHRSLGALATTRDEKAWMVRVLPATGTAVLNGDDPNVAAMRGGTTARVVTFGFGPGCDVRGLECTMQWPDGMRLRLAAFGEEGHATLRLFGRHLAYAALAAVAAATACGVPLATALERLQSLTPVPGRMAPVTLPGGIIVLRDDFKSTLETIETALQTFATIPAKRRIVVLGDISEPPGSQTSLYQDVGLRVAAVAQHLVVVGPRRSLERYRTGARQGGMPRAAIHAGGRTPQEAVDLLRGLLQPGDVVLLKGRDTQRLERIQLLLAGRAVVCDLTFCNLRETDCAHCPMLERGAHRGHAAVP